MHGSAARGIAIPFAPSSLLPCPPSRSRSFVRSLARLLSNSPRFLPPLSTLFSCHPSHSVGSAGIYPRVFAFSLSLTFLFLSLSLFFHFCVSLSFTSTASTQACRHAYTRGESGPHCEPKTKFSATSPPSMFPIMRC